MKEIESAYEKLLKAIFSCKTPPHLEGAFKLIEAFEAIFNNENVAGEIRIVASMYRNDLLKAYMDVEKSIKLK